MHIQDLKLAKEELESLYEWLSQSPTGEDRDLEGLNIAIEVIDEQIDLQKELNGIKSLKGRI